MKRVIVSLGLFVFSYAAIAANSAATLKEAVGLMENGNLQEAYQLLVTGHDDKSSNPQEWFLLGLSAKKAGYLDKGIECFEKVIELSPDANRAKLELATLLFKKGDKGRTKQLLLDVKATNPAIEASNNIDRFLATVEATGERKNWRVRGSAGWMHDSNANAGPDSDFVTLFNLPFVLSKNAQESSDNAILLNLAVDHVRPISENFNWQSSISLGSTDYNDLDNLDVLNLSISSGPTWLQNRKTIWSIPLSANRVKVGHQESYYSSSIGVSPQVRYGLSEKVSLSMAANLSDKHYHDNSARDSISKSLSPSVSWQVLESTNVGFGASYGVENSGIDTVSSDYWSLNTSMFHSFNKDLSVSINASYTDAGYEEKEAAYDNKRKDKTVRLGVNFIYNIAEIGSELVLSSSLTNNDSNIDTYEYDRNQISLSLRKVF